MKKVSIVVPVYNMEKYLEKCMDSLVNQTLEDIEIIVVNDGSNDNSIKILNKYKKKYPNKIIIIDQENQGISAARNNGIDIATGEYIGFVDSDDYVKYDMFEKLYNKIEKSKSDIVVCNYQKYFMKSEEYIDIDMVKNINKNNIFEEPTILNKIYFAPWNKLYKRSLFENIRFPIQKKYEDINAILKVFFKAKKIDKISECLYIYRINENGETLTINKKICDIVFIFEDLINYIKGDKKYDLIKSEFKKLCIDQLFYYLILSYSIKDKRYIMDFRKDVIRVLNKNFKNWKYTFIFDSKLEMKLISKLIISNNLLFNLFINTKCR